MLSGDPKTRSSEPAQRHVVLVEDDVPLRRALGRHLVQDGYRVTMMGTPVELAALLRSDEVPDILLVDLDLGSEDSLDVIERHASPAGVVWPVILMSGKLKPADVLRAGHLGITHVLEKPLDLAELYDAMRNTWHSTDVHVELLPGLSLVEILEAFHLAKRTVRLAVGGNPTGQLTLVGGELVDVRCGLARGEGALDTLLRRSGSTLRTLAVPDAVEPSMQRRPLSDVLSDALRRIDAQHVRRRFTPADMKAVFEVLDTSSDDHDVDMARSSPAPLSRTLSDAPPSSDRPPTGPRPSDEAVLEAAAETLLDLEVGRVGPRAGEVFWLTPSEAHEEERAMARRVVERLPQSLRKWPYGQWMALVRRDVVGAERGLGFFGAAPWVCAAPLSGAYARHRFYTAVVRLVHQSVELIPHRRDPHPTLSFPPSGDGLDERVVQMCRDMVRRVQAAAACMVLQRAPSGIVHLRGHFDRGAGVDVVPSPRWNLAKSIVEIFADADEIELFIGSTSGTTMFGTVLHGRDIFLCRSEPNVKLGHFRSTIRPELAKLTTLLDSVSEPNRADRPPG